MNNNKGFINILVAVIIVVVIGVVGYFAITKKSEAPNQSNPQITYQTKEECEQQSGESCDFVMCDVAAPGKTIEETCGSVGRGWMPVFPEEENSETASWRTYKNDEYGFEFKYPSSIKFEGYPAYNSNEIIEKIKNNKNALLFFDDGSTYYYQQLGLFSGVIRDRNSNFRLVGVGVSKKPVDFSTLEEYVINFKKQAFDTGSKEVGTIYVFPIEAYSINKLRRYVLGYQNMSGANYTLRTIFLEKGDYIYQIGYEYSATLIKDDSSSRDQSKEVVIQVKFEKQVYDLNQKIIQTFKFIDEKNSTAYSKILFGTQEITDNNDNSFKFKTPITVTVISPNAKKVDILTGPTGTGVAGLEKVRLSDSNPKDGFIFDIPNCKILGYDDENVPPRIYINIEYLNGQNSNRMLTFPYCLNS